MEFDQAETSSAVLLLNTTGRDTDLTGWSLVTESDQNQRLAGAVTASETIAVLVPKGFFNPGGGVVTLLDASGLKVAGATYPSASSGAWLEQGRVRNLDTNLIGAPPGQSTRGSVVDARFHRNCRDRANVRKPA